MWSLEQLLSPVIISNNTVFPASHDSDQVLFMNKIREQKISVITKQIEPSEADLVRPEIVQSWLRSFHYGIDYMNVNPSTDDLVLGPAAFEEMTNKHALLLKVAVPYMQQLERIMAETECVIFLADEQGIILEIICGHPHIIQEIQSRKTFTFGSVWTEEQIGTTSHSLSAILGRPVQLVGPEQYLDWFGQHPASSAPIFDIYNNLVGTVNIASSFVDCQNTHTLALVTFIAIAIQNAFHAALNQELLHVALEAADEGIITINKNGVITKANMMAARILGGKEVLVGRNIHDLLDAETLTASIMESGQSVWGIDIYNKAGDRKLHLKSANPVKDYCGNYLGCVLTLRKVEHAGKAGQSSPGNDERLTFDKVLGTSTPLLHTLTSAQRYAKLDDNILLQGESGTGKEIYAQAIHAASRPAGSFVAINCAAIPKTLIESELFGYEGGAFTGAERKGRPGKIEVASGGTLFLDEIGDMPLELQAVFLRVLEEKKVMRVGGSQYQQVDFRLIAASNKNLLQLVESNQFRDDLYYRLAVFKIEIPPLRERGADVILLARSFIDAVAAKQKISAPVLSDEAMYCLLEYNWPGNVRQLKNAMTYAVHATADGVISPANLPGDVIGSASVVTKNKAHAKAVGGYIKPESNFSLKDMEKITIMQALIASDGNIKEAAVQLGMSRATLYRKVNEYQLLKRIREI